MQANPPAVALRRRTSSEIKAAVVFLVSARLPWRRIIGRNGKWEVSPATTFDLITPRRLPEARPFDCHRGLPISNPRSAAASFPSRKRNSSGGPDNRLRPPLRFGLGRAGGNRTPAQPALKPRCLAGAALQANADVGGDRPRYRPQFPRTLRMPRATERFRRPDHALFQGAGGTPGLRGENSRNRPSPKGSLIPQRVFEHMAENNLGILVARRSPKAIIIRFEKMVRWSVRSHRHRATGRFVPLSALRSPPAKVPPPPPPPATAPAI